MAARTERLERRLIEQELRIFAARVVNLGGGH
jgi:hypothetical protein